MEERLVVKEEDIIGLKRRVWEEQKKVWRITFPSMLARVTSFGVFVVTQAFIGRFGQTQLAAYALVQVFSVKFANGIFLGMSSATETMCGQAFGAKQKHMLGVYLQRSWIINVTTATLLVPIFVFSGYIFKLIGEEGSIAEAAGYISLWFIPVIYSFALGLTSQKFLQSQLRNMIVGWLSAVSFVIHIFLSWLFVVELDWGVPGAMSAVIISLWLVVIGTFVYILGGWCNDTWKGFTFDAFTDLVPVVKLSIASGVMLCLELWYTAILVLLAGYMTNAAVAISAFSICLNISAWEFMLCLGFLVSASVRVSNELGRGNAEAAKFSIKVILSTSACMGIMFWTLCLAFGHIIGYVFTSDEEVVESVSSLSVLLAFSILLNSVQSVLSGVAVGAGRQSIVAFVNLGSYYMIGVPIGLLLGYLADLDVKGIWIGMLVGVVVQTLVLSYITWRTDWDEEVHKATIRLNRFVRPSEESNERTNEGCSEESNQRMNGGCE